MPTIRSIVITSGLAASVVAAQPAVEVSEDGHQTVRVAPAPTDNTGWVSESASVPFGTTPDVEINLRRQIGGLQVADMNNDGFMDVVAVCYISNSFPPYDEFQDQIYYGDGSTIESTPSYLTTLETHTGDVQVGDINGDGRTDVVTIHGGGVRSDHLRVYYNGPGGLSGTADYVSTWGTRGWGTSGVIFDIDGDGANDVLTTNQGLNPDPFRPMALYRNLGSGLATVPSWTSAESSLQGGASVGDFDGDGDLDIGVSKWANFESGIYRNDNGTPTADPVFTVGVTTTDRGSGFADFDNNGFLDFVVGGPDTRLYAQDNGVFTQTWTANPPFSGPQDLRVFDVDQDGDLDVAEIHFSDGRSHIYLNNDGVLDSIPSWSYDASEVGTALAFGDINNDGRPDLVTGYSGNVSIRVFFAEAPDCPADLAEPFGQLTAGDISTFANAFNANSPIADLAEPFGELTFGDIAAFTASFVAGCP
jgi:hypothetical protein